MNKSKWLSLGFTALLAFTGACGEDDDDGTSTGCDPHDLLCVPDGGADLPDAAAGTVVRSKPLQFVAEPNDVVAGGSIELTVDFNTDEVRANVTATELPEGQVVTLWWAVFNKPELCNTPSAALGVACSVPDMVANPDVEGAILYSGPHPGGAHTVDASGTHTFPEVVLGVIPSDGADDPFLSGPGPGNGLNNIEGEVHLFIQTHGEPLTGAELLAQETQFNGGCRAGEAYEGQDPPKCSLFQVAAFVPAERP